MAIVKLQGDKEKTQGIYYEFDTSSTPLGEGGMGKVYRGKRVNMHTHEVRDVAIKFMFANLPPNVIQRAEAEASIRIQHDNLVEMMGFLAVENRSSNGVTSVRYHVVSELLTGVSLSDLLQGDVNDQTGKPVAYAQKLYQMYNTNPEKFAVVVIKKILSGIMALHDAGYIHRDIDPSNIMITQDEKIKLIDFGIAKKVEGLKTHDRNLTTAGQFMGKPQYAAPELIIGDLKNQNKPTDIYAVGVLLFQLIVGHLPFEGPANVVLNAHLHTKMPLKQIKDGGLRKIVDRATAKDCTKRYQSAAEFRAALDAWTSKPGPDIIPMKLLAICGGILSAAIIVTCIVLFWPKSEQKTDTDTDEDKNVVVIQEDENSMSSIRKKLLNRSEAKDGFERLKTQVKNGDAEAVFLLSRLYAVSSGPFTLHDDFVTMQGNLNGVVEPDPKEAHRLLRETIKLKSDHYPALYELACDYYEGPALTGGEERSLRYAKELLDKAYKYASEAKDPVFVDKVSALLRKY